MTGIEPTPENFRSEMARHRLTRQEIGKIIAMNTNMLTMYLNRGRTLSPWATHNIAYGINRLTSRRIFNINMSLGVLPPRSSSGDSPRSPVLF